MIMQKSQDHKIAKLRGGDSRRRCATDRLLSLSVTWIAVDWLRAINVRLFEGALDVFRSAHRAASDFQRFDIRQAGESHRSVT